MSQLTVRYPYANFTLEIIVDACKAVEDTPFEEGEPAKFIIEEIKLDGKCAKELIGIENWDDAAIQDFNFEVEEHYIEEQQ